MPIRTTPAIDRPSAREAHFERYHKANPEVYQLFERFCREMIDRGISGFGAPVIFERVRWETFIRTDAKPYKLPNVHRPYYAREFRRRNPDLANHIKIRRLRGE